jgi:hypothetical protein
MIKNNLLLIAIVTVLAFTINACSTSNSSSSTETAFLEKHGLSGLTVEEIVSKLDSSTTDPAGLKASITSEYLILSDDTSEVRLALPADKFYLSFAPYVNQTHPCATHSLISCQGELVDRPIHALITDSTGKELLNADLSTMDNGFVGVWLPRDIDATIMVTYNGMTAQQTVSTAAGSETCLTTLKLN